MGVKLEGQDKRSRCDNMTVVAIVNAGISRHLQAMNLVRCLTFLAATLEFRTSAE